jgi:hypothetical protein
MNATKTSEFLTKCHKAKVTGVTPAEEPATGGMDTVNTVLNAKNAK